MRVDNDGSDGIGGPSPNLSNEIDKLRWPRFFSPFATGMAKSSKLVAAKRGKVLLVRRRSDGLWMFPGGRKRARETEKACLRREIREELPKLKLGRISLWKEVKAKNKRSGRKMSDAIFIAKSAKGRLAIGDKKEIDRAAWQKPRGIRLTATSRYIRDRLFPR